MLSLLLLACSNSSKPFSLDGVEVHTLRIRYNNSHLVEAGGLTVLVDAGFERDAQRLESAVLKAGLAPGELDAVVLTHAHGDHAGGALHFQETFGVPVVLGEGDVPMAEAGVTDLATLCPTNKLAERRLESDSEESYSSLVPDFVVPSTGTTDLGTLLGGSPAGIELRPVPGHTDGTIVIDVGQGLFVGDLFRGSILGRSAATHFYQCDVPGTQDDIRTLLADKPDVTVFFPGHFGPVHRAKVQDLVAEAP